jgi:mono/diheme cytochrome c family protein
MRDKVILGVTLSIVLLLTLVIYGVVDTQRAPTTRAADLETAVREGKHLYAQYCVQCHGPLGEGCIGPALNRNTWRPRTADGATNPDFDDASEDLMQLVITRGRQSNQPGQQMPPWGIEENGPLNDQEIEDIIAFIQYGEWGATLEDAPSATGLNEVLPAYPGFADPNQLARVKQLMLSKGCLNCHALGKGGGRIGADLTDVGSRRTAEWLRKWIKDPKSVPAGERGPNLFLVGPTATVPAPGGVDVSPSGSPAPTVQAFPMNTTYMPTIPLTEEELNLLVDYLSKARTTTR